MTDYFDEPRAGYTETTLRMNFTGGLLRRVGAGLSLKCASNYVLTLV